MNHRSLISNSLLTPFILLSACGQPAPNSDVKEAWNRRNDPLILNGEFERSFDRLPTSGKVATIPWTDTYWPNNFGGIASRWNATVDANFSYQPASEADVRKLSAAELALLSPAEKFDIYTGRFDYPLLQRERQRVSRNDKDWEGLCHGWAPAALIFSEPKPVLATGPSGVAVPFASSDIKALLTYYEGELANVNSRQVGTRCNIDVARYPREARRHPECKGINAGAFHVALTNMVGKEGKGFVADVSHGLEIWNQPVYGYTSTVVRMQPPSWGAAWNTVREAVIHTEMLYTDDVDASWDAQQTTPASEESIEYDYRVEIDFFGRIVGGAWMGSNLLDFIWVQDKPEFVGEYQPLEALYQLSLKGPALAAPQKQGQLHPNPAPHGGRSPRPRS